MPRDPKEIDETEEALRELAEKEKRAGVVDQQTAAEGEPGKTEK